MKHIKTFESFPVNKVDPSLAAWLADNPRFPIGTKVVYIDDSDLRQTGGPKVGDSCEIEDIHPSGIHVKLKGYPGWYMNFRFENELEYNAKKYNL